MNYPFKVCGSVLTYLLFKDHLGIRNPNAQFAIDLSSLGVTLEACFLFTDYLLSELAYSIHVCSMFFQYLSTITSKHIVPALHYKKMQGNKCFKVFS